ncbi:max-binding protein MNT-like isoform X3 [Maniola hyperantus]|uniref:max-binding protein MNT-like isoform X3 n=1 Tax=Aphantopus hyperantus TaxID=2795564 RepID=UPI0015687E9F|nr:max-binding protein MNT-like isoform X2 [Maniola hyperantus]
MGILMESTEVNLVTTNYQQRGAKPEFFGAMSAPGDAFYSDTLHTIAINTRETEYGSIVEPIPIVLKTYQQFQSNCYPINGYGYPQSLVASVTSAPCAPEAEEPSTSNTQSPIKEEDTPKVARPPKKKWIKEYLEEEPKLPVSVRLTGVSVTRSNGVVRPTSPVSVTPSAPAPLEPVLASVAPIVSVAPSSDFVQEHSRPRNTNISHGIPQIPSPPSVSSNGSGSSSNGSGSASRAGTREVHNKLEKNRRAHLKECFELLKRQLPATPDDKKTSNLSILGSAIRYIQVLRRKERECEHEMERLAREKIAAQQRLAALKREVSVRTTVRPRSIDAASEDKDRDENVNGQILGLPISIISSPSPPRSAAQMESSPPRTINLSTKLRTLPIQITPTTSQVVRTSYGTRHNTLTLTTIAPAEAQVVSSGGLVMGGAALQLLSTSAGLRVLQAPSIHTNGVTTDSNRIVKENGVVTPPPVSTEGSVVVSSLTPIVVSQPAAHLLQTHTLTHKMVETQMVKGSVAPLTVSAQYLSATTIVKPVVVVSSAHEPHPPHQPHPHEHT